MHQIALEQQQKSFVLVHHRLKQAKKRFAKYADRNSKFEVGDPVLYKVRKNGSKLNVDWKPYFRIIEKTGSVTFVLKHQLDGTIVNKVHAQDIRKAPVDDWEIPPLQGHMLRKTNYVVPPENDDSQSETGSDDDKAPLARIAQRYRRQRHDSDSEEDIPLMELAKRLKASTCQTSDGESDQSSQMSDRENNQGISDKWDSESYEEIGEESMSTD